MTRNREPVVTVQLLNAVITRNPNFKLPLTFSLKQGEVLLLSFSFSFSLSLKQGDVLLLLSFWFRNWWSWFSHLISVSLPFLHRLKNCDTWLFSSLSLHLPFFLSLNLFFLSFSFSSDWSRWKRKSFFIWTFGLLLEIVRRKESDFSHVDPFLPSLFLFVSFSHSFCFLFHFLSHQRCYHVKLMPFKLIEEQEGDNFVLWLSGL